MSGNLSNFFDDNFDFNSVEDAPSGEFLSLPAGFYKVVILDSEVKESANKPGSSYLSLRLQIADGPHQNRTLFANLTVTNRNEVAVKIGKENIARLVKACGLAKLQDSSQFISKVVEAKVNRKKDDRYGDSEGFANNVVGFYALGTSPQSTGHSEPVEGNPAPVAADDVAPW